MSFSSLYLDAFAEVAQLKSFSKAALKLNITQSALSQRVLNLEAEIGSSVFIRDPSGLRLTELGTRLLRYCHSKSLLEAEFMESLKAADSKELSGIVRIGAFSTIGRSVILPTLSKFLKTNSRVGLELRSEELRDLPSLLSSGAVDLIFQSAPLEKQGIENHQVGIEKYVLIHSTSKTSRDDIYLDYDEADMITLDFLKVQKRKVPNIKRNFLSDIETLIEGVKQGVGRAVVPLHLIEGMSGIEVVKGYQPMHIPVYLTYYTQAFYTSLQKAVIDLIREQVPKHLS